MRAPEEWEGDFLEFQAMVDEKYAKEYPPEFLERQEAFAAKLEAEQGGGADMDQSRLQTRAEGGGTSSFSQFYAGDDAIDEDSDVRCTVRPACGVYRPWQRLTRVYVGATLAGCARYRTTRLLRLTSSPSRGTHMRVRHGHTCGGAVTGVAAAPYPDRPPPATTLTLCGYIVWLRVCRYHQ